MRQVKPGSIQAAVRASISEAGGLDCASDDLGLSASALSRSYSCEEDRPGGLGVNHLHRLGRIVPKAAVPIAEHFADLAGGVFHPVPTGGAAISDLNTVVKEFSDVLDHHARSHYEASENPWDYTAKEAEKAVGETDDLIRAALVYRAAMLTRAGL